MVDGAAGFVLCVLILHVAEGFASADATKGLSDRPLETFGATQVNWFLLKVFS